MYKSVYLIVPKSCENDQLPPNSTSQITYHDLETFNGDSSSIYVLDPEFSLSNLQPGRNYSISIRAVAKGIESVEKSTTVATSA